MLLLFSHRPLGHLIASIVGAVTYEMRSCWVNEELSGNSSDGRTQP